MAQLNPDSLFQSWILSETEQIQGSILTLVQKQCIQNQITQAAQEKVSLKYDPANPQTFLQAEAELHGRINALSYLLSQSAEYERQYDPSLTPRNLVDQDPSSY